MVNSPNHPASPQGGLSAPAVWAARADPRESRALGHSRRMPRRRACTASQEKECTVRCEHRRTRGPQSAGGAPQPLRGRASLQPRQPGRRGRLLETRALVEHPVHAPARLHGVAGEDLRACARHASGSVLQAQCANRAYHSSPRAPRAPRPHAGRGDLRERGGCQAEAHAGTPGGRRPALLRGGAALTPAQGAGLGRRGGRRAHAPAHPRRPGAACRATTSRRWAQARGRRPHPYLRRARRPHRPRRAPSASRRATWPRLRAAALFEPSGVEQAADRTLIPEGERSATRHTRTTRHSGCRSRPEPHRGAPIEPAAGVVASRPGQPALRPLYHMNQRSSLSPT
jgi:hypothetical protein